MQPYHQILQVQSKIIQAGYAPCAFKCSLAAVKNGRAVASVKRDFNNREEEAVNWMLLLTAFDEYQRTGVLQVWKNPDDNETTGPT